MKPQSGHLIAPARVRLGQSSKSVSMFVLHMTSVGEDGGVVSLGSALWYVILRWAVTVARTRTDEHDGSLERGSVRAAERHRCRFGGVGRTAATV